MAAKKKVRKKSVSRDRKLVAGRQKHEVAYEARRSGKSTSRVKAARKAAGPSRKKVRKKLAG
jgi:hypothetical protein